MPTFERYYTNEGFRLYYRHVVVNPLKPTVILLHGWSGNNSCFIRLEKFLHSWRYNTITPDLRGHGLSDRHRRRKYYRWNNFVGDLHGLLEDIDAGAGQDKTQTTSKPTANASPIYILGYSAGGTIALLHEQAYPGRIKKIIAVSANTRNPLKNWKIGLLTPLARTFIYAGSQIFKFDRRKNYADLDLLKVQGYWASVYQGLKSMPMDINLWLLLNYAGLRLKQPKKIVIPVWLLRGEHDKFVSLKEAQKIAKRLPRARVISIKDTGHYLVTHHRPQLIKTLQEIIKK